MECICSGWRMLVSRITGVWVVYLARDFVSCGPEQMCDMTGLGLEAPGEKQPGL